MALRVDRHLALSVIMVTVVLVMLGRLFYIQVVNSSYKISAESNVLRRVVQYPARGIIYDRGGKMLVYNRACYDLMVVPHQVKPFDTLLLASLLEVTPEEVRANLAAARQYSYYKESLFLKQIEPEAYGRFQEYMYQFSGFYAQARTLRHYPEPIAAHLLGYVGEVNERIIARDPYYKTGDYIGVSGIENSYERHLRGQKGVRMYVVDVHNRLKGSYREGAYDTSAVAGKDLHLTLSADLQAYGEQLLKGVRGAIVAIEPSTGEVLALVSSPSYDPNVLVGRRRSANFVQLDTNRSKPLFNRALMALYPPGSTFKVVNGLVGLQEGVAHPSDPYKCLGRYTVGRGVGCHGHPYNAKLSDAIRSSCNAYFCHVFRKILDNRRAYPDIEGAFTHWAQYVHNFGFGHRIGVGMPEELPGIVPTVDFYNRYFRKGGWSSLTVISLAIGQGELGTTPLQMANLASIIANRGYYIAPHLVKGADTVRHQVGVDAKHFEPVVEGMRKAVAQSWGEGGTGWRANMPGLDVCGKTGTAQNPHGEDHAVFIAFAPKDNPKIAISVYVENAGGGGKYAAPVAGLMIERYLRDSVITVRTEEFVKTALPEAEALHQAKLAAKREKARQARLRDSLAALRRAEREAQVAKARDTVVAE